MKIATYFLSIGILATSGCASVSSKMPADSSSVTIRHGTLTEMSDVQNEAQTHCARYGKNAYFRGRYDSNNATFDCR